MAVVTVSEAERTLTDKQAITEYLVACGIDYEQWLLDLVAAEPDLTLEEIRARLRSEKKLKVGTTSIWRFYDRHAITFKKNSARRRTGSS